MRKGDALACRAWIATHSRSFYLSSLLLPRRVREASWALYAFCRRADDAVDEKGDRAARVASLRARLDAVYKNVEKPTSSNEIDRAFAAVVARYRIPRALPSALLDGMAMDLAQDRYRTVEELYVYCFRVASVVGLMMTQVMGYARPDALYRACDLGIAMQLTNIARDVGEDAGRGRVYLPDEILRDAGTSADEVVAARDASPPLREAVRRLLALADAHYAAADRGVPLLPRGCRLAIASSRRIYAAIGDDLRRAGHDSITRRARTSTARKLWLVARALPAIVARPSPPSPGPADALLEKLLAEVGLG